MTQQNAIDSSATEALRQAASQIQARVGIADLAKAYVAASGELQNVLKDSNNPHFGSNYASLAATLDTIRPVFAKHGLALFQAPGVLNAAGDRISLISILFHTSGQSIRIETELPVGAKLTAQAAGSAITYARRYAAMGIAGLAPVDDDANAASAQAAPPKRSRTEAAAALPAYADEADALRARIAACTSVGKEGTEDPLELRSLKNDVVAFGDEELVKVWTAKLSALKSKK